MLSVKLALSAFGLEVGAWSAAALLHGRSDGALASYLLLHAAASALLALALLPLVPKRVAVPRWATALLMAVCSFAVPIAGFLGVLAAFVFLRLLRQHRIHAHFDSLELPEFDQDQRSQRSFRHAGLQSFLSNAQAPEQARLRAMAALQHVSGRTASPLLRTVLRDPSEDLRLLAYGMLDNLEKRINRAIDEQLDALQALQAQDPQGAAVAEGARRLSDLYWELVYQELVQGDLRRHAIGESLRYCERALQDMPEHTALVLRRGRLLHALGRREEAQAAYARARALGLPATRVLPYEAELAFERRDFRQVASLMQDLAAWDALPRLRPVIEYWGRP